jgi:hypothetical protein
MRALYWVFLNKPNGNWMRRISDSGDLLTTCVTVRLSDGTVIKRRKGDGINEYLLNGELYKDFGYNIPQEILDKTDIIFRKFNNIEIPVNIAVDENPNFMVDESNITKAYLLNRLTGADIIEKAKNLVTKDIRDNNSKIKIYDNDIIEIKNELSDLPDVKLLLKEIKDIEKKYRRYENKLVTFNKFKVIKDGIKIIEKDYEKIIRILNILNELKNIEDMKKKSDLISEKILLCKKYTSVELKIKRCNKIIDNVDLIKIEKNTGKCLEYNTDLIRVENLRDELRLLTDKIAKTQSEIKRCVKELKRFKGITCPVCGNKI